ESSTARLETRLAPKGPAPNGFLGVSASAPCVMVPGLRLQAVHGSVIGVAGPGTVLKRGAAVGGAPPPCAAHRGAALALAEVHACRRVAVRIRAAVGFLGAVLTDLRIAAVDGGHAYRGVVGEADTAIRRALVVAVADCVAGVDVVAPGALHT